MSIKKELSLLYNLLTKRVQSLPVRVKTRADRDIEDIFNNYQLIEDPVMLESIKKRAENKLLILEMSGEAKSNNIPIPIPGVKTYIVKDGRVQEGKSEVKFSPDYSN